MKLIVAGFLSILACFLAGCADLGPDADELHDQQLQRSFAAPGQPTPINAAGDPDVPPHQRVPGE